MFTVRRDLWRRFTTKSHGEKNNIRFKIIGDSSWPVFNLPVHQIAQLSAVSPSEISSPTLTVVIRTNQIDNIFSSDKNGLRDEMINEKRLCMLTIFFTALLLSDPTTAHYKHRSCYGNVTSAASNKRASAAAAAAADRNSAMYSYQRWHTEHETASDGWKLTKSY